MGIEENTKKRIKTESGRWIPASYKTTMYPCIPSCIPVVETLLLTVLEQFRPDTAI